MLGITILVVNQSEYEVPAYQHLQNSYQIHYHVTYVYI